MNHLAWDSDRIVAIATESAREAGVVEIVPASLQETAT